MYTYLFLDEKIVKAWRSWCKKWDEDQRKKEDFH